MYTIGTVVRHQTFGEGRVVSATAEDLFVIFESGKKCQFLQKNIENYLEIITKEHRPKSKAPTVIYAETNADFLNKAFGTEYKKWMRCGWDYDEETIVWMVPFDNKIRQGWRNTIVDSCTVREDFVGREDEKLLEHKKLKNFRRIVVKKEQEYGRYVILGLYTYDFEHSVEENKRIWIKISDEII